MRFAHPQMLWLILPALAAAWWIWYRIEGRRASLLHPAPAASKERWSGKVARWLPPILKTAALILIVVGLARPQRISSVAGESGRGVDILLLIDTSESMNAIDFKPSNRLDAAKDTALRFVSGRVHDRIGLVIFGGAALLASPLTLDYDALATRLSELKAGMTHAPGTAIGDGIVTGVNHLRHSTAKSRIMILLTDGRSNADLIDPITAAKTAKTFGIRIYTIGTAKKGTSLIPIDDPVRGRVMARLDEDLDEETLERVASISGGKYYRATNLGELRSIYAAIDKLEKSEVELPRIISRNDIYRYPVGAAVLLLLLQMTLVNTLLLRWP